MLASILVGTLVAEGAHRYYRSVYCPRPVSKKSEELTEASSQIHCMRIAIAVIFGVLAVRYIAFKIEENMSEKRTFFKPRIQFLSNQLGKYKSSIPFFVANVCYFCRRDALAKLGDSLFQIYRKVEDLTELLAEVALNPEESIRKVNEELDREIYHLLGTKRRDPRRLPRKD
jgi:hypothetical protein